MYQCAKCGMGVLVTNLPQPIRACNCTRLIKRDPIGIKEWIKFYLFGINCYNEIPEKIIMNMSATASGKSYVRI